MILEKEVMFPNSSIDETYYSVKVADYAAALIIAKDKHILLVKQYRPVVDGYTNDTLRYVNLEEEPKNAMIREVYEETVR